MNELKAEDFGELVYRDGDRWAPRQRAEMQVGYARSTLLTNSADRARSTLKRPEYWRGLEALATELLRAGRMSGEEVEAFLVERIERRRIEIGGRP